jgi:hypothetical protein
MSLIQRLEEASTIPVEQLKDKMKKDPRVKVLFTREPQLDQIKDVPELIRTLRFYVFSNPSVRAHVENRADRRELSKHWWKRMAATKPTDTLTQMDLDWLSMVVKELFKDVGFVGKKDLSKRAMDAIYEFITEDRTYALDAYAQREINSLNLKPAKPITVYRGMSFSSDNMKVLGTGVGEGLRFLQAVRKGTRIVDLDLDKPTRWTTNKEEALELALHGKGGGWRQKDDSGKVTQYDRLLAFVVSTLASPDDIIVQLSELSKVTGWPGESYTTAYNAVVLHPGKHVVRIVSKHDTRGTIDPVGAEPDDSPQLSELKQSLSFFGKILKLPIPEVRFEDFSRFTGDPTVMSQLGTLNDPEIAAKLEKLFGTVVRYYQKNLKDIDIKALATQAGDEAATFRSLSDISELFRQTVRHTQFANPNGRDRASRTAGYQEVSALEDPSLAMSAMHNDGDLMSMARVVKEQKRFTDWRTGGVFAGLARIADPSFKPGDKIHLTGWANQKKMVDLAVKGFFQAVGEPMPDTPAEQAARMLELGKRAMQVSWVARFLQDVKAAALQAAE